MELKVSTTFVAESYLTPTQMSQYYSIKVIDLDIVRRFPASKRLNT